jgi:hypothetical protein
VKIDYIAELRAKRTTPTKPLFPSRGNSPSTPRNTVENQHRMRQAEALKRDAATREAELARRAASDNPREQMEPAQLAMAEARVDELYRDAIQRQLEVLQQA